MGAISTQLNEKYDEIILKNLANSFVLIYFFTE